MMASVTQPFLPLTGDAADAMVDRARLADSRREAARESQRRITGKRAEVFKWIAQMGENGLTMAEMAAISGRSINCWTQPFTDLRNWGVITTTDRKRNGGVVHVLKREIRVQPNGDWE